MNSLDDEIRGTLRSEADRLREVRPLHLPPEAVRRELRAAPRAAGRLRSWRSPIVAMAVIVLVAAGLVTLKSLRNEHAAAPTASPSAVTPTAAFPTYYVGFGVLNGGKAGKEQGWGISAGDGQTGRTIGSFPLAKGAVLSNSAVSGAADDRTFVVSATVTGITTGQGLSGQAGHPVIKPATWYLVRLSPGTADPVHVRKLPIHSPAGKEVSAIALSGDGTELAVASEVSKSSYSISVYSVATGRLKHSWSATISSPPGRPGPVADLSWVGDSTVGFAVTYTSASVVREEVRKLNINADGAGLLADSRVVWSQDVPAPPGGHYQESTPEVCGTPFLTGNGQSVVCAASIYSASTKRLTAAWLRYPLAAPKQVHVIGSVQQPTDVSSLDPTDVEWANSSGTEVIGDWNPSVITYPGGDKTTTTSNYNAFIGNGKVTSFPYILDTSQQAW